MAHRSDPELVVLNGLRLKGLTTGSALADSTGLGRREADDLLDGLAAHELVARREGRVSGWSLTPAGRVEHARRLAADVEQSGCRDALARAYEEFLLWNADLLKTCTAWQVREEPGGTRPNDHSDAEYDGAVVARLAAIDEAIQPTCRRLSSLMERMSTYAPRLASARRRVEAGELDWFTRPMIDSYHSVWFELHEDFLMSLGRERASEPVSGSTPSSSRRSGGGEPAGRRVS